MWNIKIIKTKKKPKVLELSCDILTLSNKQGPHCSAEQEYHNSDKIKRFGIRYMYKILVTLVF